MSTSRNTEAQSNGRARSESSDKMEAISLRGDVVKQKQIVTLSGMGSAGKVNLPLIRAEGRNLGSSMGNDDKNARLGEIMESRVTSRISSLSIPAVNNAADIDK